MRKMFVLCAVCLMAITQFSYADVSITEGNVWTTTDGQKYYTCPVMDGEGLVSTAPAYSDVKGVRYYHCCAGCESKFQANPSQYLANFAVPANVLSVDESGKHFSDPISGKKRTVNDKTNYCDQNGKRYYFASKKSLNEFCKTSGASASAASSCTKPCSQSCKKTCGK
ncbi:YHS domain-containing protein [bacterium]|nr:YHS domain-containing protein [bacterium]